jgi:CRISPR/Cas system-associated endonuclease Cas3-HD
MPAKPGAGFARAFHYGLKTLKRAYEASRVTADKEKANFEQEAAKIEEEADSPDRVSVERQVPRIKDRKSVFRRIPSGTEKQLEWVLKSVIWLG